MMSGAGIVAIEFTCSTIYLTVEKEGSSYGFILYILDKVPNS